MYQIENLSQLSFFFLLQTPNMNLVNKANTHHFVLPPITLLNPIRAREMISFASNVVYIRAKIYENCHYFSDLVQ